MENEVSGSARPCEDLLSFEVKLKVNYSRGRNGLQTNDSHKAIRGLVCIRHFVP